MKKPKIPKSEKKRLETLKSYKVLGTPSEAEFDRITALAKNICETPESLITFVDSESLWIKSQHLGAEKEVPRDISFCAHTINGSNPMVVEDTKKDERFHDNPFVSEETQLRFYAGAPLIAPNGEAIGSLCVLDFKPRQLSQYQIDSLKLLADNVVQVLELRLKNTQLEKQALELSDIIDSLPSLFFSQSIDGRVLLSNDKFRKFHQISGDPTGQRLTSLISEENAETFSRLDQMVISDGQMAETEDDVTDAAGHSRVLQTSRFPYKNEKGEIYALGYVAHDITGKRALENQVLHRAKLASLGEMSASAGHEINNPLSIIMGHVSKVKKLKTRGELNDEDLSKSLDRIDKSASRISKIVSGIRAFSRFDSESKMEFDIIETIEEPVHMLEEIYSKDGIKVHFDCALPKGSYYVEGHRGQVQQVIINLISNAKDALNQVTVPEIFVKVQVIASNIQFEVKDNGSGIPENIQQRIFDPFFTTKGVNKGTGIGLNLVRKFILDHQGNIELDSILGEGTTFRVTLPLASEGIQDSFNFDESGSLSTPQFNRQKILLVDDEPEIQELLADSLSTLGFDVLLAQNGAQALDVFEKNANDISLILCDITMPVMDGFTFLKNMRAQKELPQPKFVFVTGGVNVDISAPLKEIEDLVDGLIYKPFSQSELFSTVVRVLEGGHKKTKIVA